MLTSILGSWSQRPETRNLNPAPGSRDKKPSKNNSPAFWPSFTPEGTRRNPAMQFDYLLVEIGAFFLDNR